MKVRIQKSKFPRKNVHNYLQNILKSTFKIGKVQKSLIIFVFCTYISVSFQIPFAPINRVCGAYDIKPLNSFKILSYLFVRNCDHFCLNQNLALDPANIYLFKVNNKNTRKRCEIYSKLTIKTP